MGDTQTDTGTKPDPGGTALSHLQSGNIAHAWYLGAIHLLRYVLRGGLAIVLWSAKEGVERVGSNVMYL